MGYEIKGKVAIVTGASRGLGEAVARSFVKQGAKVVISSSQRSANAGNKVAEDLGENALYVAADVTNDEDLKNLVEKAVEFGEGKLDIVLNNAGYATLDQDFEQEDVLDDFEKTLSINVRAPIVLTRLALPYIKKSKGILLYTGSVVS